MAAYAQWKNEFKEDEKSHNLMRWLYITIEKQEAEKGYSDDGDHHSCGTTKKYILSFFSEAIWMGGWLVEGTCTVLLKDFEYSR